MARHVWTYVGGRAGNKPPPTERAAITAACEKPVAEVLRPRSLPEIRPLGHVKLSGCHRRHVAWQQVPVPHALPLG